MGRHRNDPRGTGQVLAITGAVLVVLVLVVLGAFFLYRSVMGPGTANMPEGDEVMAEAEDEEDLGTLHVRVTGSSTEILVRVTGGEVLTDTSMSTGEYVTYDEPQLDVTISEPDAVEVFVNGEPYDLDTEAEEYSFSVRPDD
ncbi:DUF4115 domain-containing protein [Lipingzhangella sp. LS1_29]|uniref:DUF4115 domain-containing protein n=1 Tax=Lipingzhangella rawalii TaxID=2055835 RepID=A0ABU2H862_9ACTN|nr:DUF4115 domain-containing protein [Lipingzhangella rawalii]